MATLAKDRAEAHRLFAEGTTSRAIAKHVGMSESTVRKWRREWPGLQQQSPRSQDAKDLHIAALQQQVRDRIPVTPDWQNETDYAELWRMAEEENARRVEKVLRQGRFTIRLPAQVQAITFISDQHISTGNAIDLRRMREDAQLIGETEGVTAFLGGDAIDNHIKIPAAILASRDQPEDQLQLLGYYLSIFAHRIGVVISGNHDNWTVQKAGVDVIRRLLNEKKIHYAPDEARIDVYVGDQRYKVAMRHKYSLNSRFNQGHAVKQWWRMGDDEFDIGCVCHHHEPHIESFMAHSKERWSCRPGSYQIHSAYSRSEGFNPTQPTCPTFILRPDRRQIDGYQDMRRAVTALRAERGGK